MRMSAASSSVRLLALDLARERLLEDREHARRRSPGAAADDHVAARRRGDLGDADAHDPRPDDTDALDHRRASYRPVTVGRMGSPAMTHRGATTRAAGVGARTATR